MQRLLLNFQLALDGVLANKFRAFLTALGVIFGVAAVIAMLAIGTGAKESLLEQMKLIGTNNIVIKPIPPEDQEQQGNTNGSSTENASKLWTPGLTLRDVEAIKEVLPGIVSISPEISLPQTLVYNGRYIKSQCIGTTNDYFEQNNLKLRDGQWFHPNHSERGRPVCIIGSFVQSRLFYEENPIGQWLKCGNEWLLVIGVLERRSASKSSLQALGISDVNANIYLPAKTALRRYEDRARFGQDDIGRRQTNNQTPSNYHQLDRLVVKVADARYLRVSADVTARLLSRLHRNTPDFEVQVPELLLQQQQQTQDTFNFVLAVIAGISLLVGGIGIMNIMLASVLERIKEIGVRRSMGATSTDIEWQFLFEAVFISLLGGVIGIVLGIASANTIAASADIPTQVSLWSVLLSFGVAGSTGLVFGILPARKAARQDPIKALRVE